MKLDWKIVEEVARSLGVTPSALKKWRKRGVPHKWRRSIIKHSDGRIPVDAFDTGSEARA